jgi:hypothetical protein
VLAGDRNGVMNDLQDHHPDKLKVVKVKTEKMKVIFMKSISSETSRSHGSLKGWMNSSFFTKLENYLWLAGFGLAPLF